jgi:hypothetical protein
MLVTPLTTQIKAWRFAAPLPPAADRHWTAMFHYTQSNGEEYEDTIEDMDAPPHVPCCGDVINTRASAFTVSGEVRSGSNTIDLTSPPPAAVDRCPTDHQRTPPTTTDSHDFVELERMSCDETCRNYRVRVDRGGLVTWRGKQGVKDTGDRQGTISAGNADTLLERFQAKDFWAACSGKRPDPEQDAEAEDFYRADFLTASFGGITKTINLSWRTFADGTRLAWIVDRTSNTHQWRHGDAATEPLMNMAEDLQQPKAGVTSLMRAAHYFNPVTSTLSMEPLKHLIAKGADINATDESGWTALMYAAALNSAPTSETPVKLLLAAGADPNRKSLHGDTALMAAAYRGVLNNDLLKAGANINARNADGVTALMLLAQHIKPDDIAEALAEGADPAAHDNQGRTALDYLQAAACNKLLVPLPTLEYGGGVYILPISCEQRKASTPYRESEQLLTKAIKQQPVPAKNK